MRILRPECPTVLSSCVVLSVGGLVSTKTLSCLVVALPALSAVVMVTSEGPSGRLALTVYLPLASAWPLAWTPPPETVTVAYGSVVPLNVAGEVLMRPSSAEPASSSVGDAGVDREAPVFADLVTEQVG